jgi:hypothetical protein
VNLLVDEGDPAAVRERELIMRSRQKEPPKRRTQANPPAGQDAKFFAAANHDLPNRARAGLMAAALSAQPRTRA